ncbi:MAG: thioredoxin family protein [Bacteroidia bacterium]|nr:thioredoxin family protein [Bacteroidia bacterium]
MKYFVSIFIIISLSFTTGKKQAHPGYKVGEQAVDFKLKGVDGKYYSLADFNKSKGFIVIFTCNHCPFAQAYENRIISLHKKYSLKGIPVIAINPNDPVKEPEDNYENMQKRSKDHKYPFIYLIDETQQTARTYGAARTPHVFFMDAKRIIRYIGAIDDNFEEPEQVKEKYLENAIDAFLKGKNVSVTQTKAIGCGIKWK